MASENTIIVENVRGQWIVDKDSTSAFQEEGYGYGDGALIEIKVAGHKGLCCHPDNPAVCQYIKERSKKMNDKPPLERIAKLLYECGWDDKLLEKYIVELFWPAFMRYEARHRLGGQDER